MNPKRIGQVTATVLPPGRTAMLTGPVTIDGRQYLLQLRPTPGIKAAGAYDVWAIEHAPAAPKAKAAQKVGYKALARAPVSPIARLQAALTEAARAIADLPASDKAAAAPAGADPLQTARRALLIVLKDVDERISAARTRRLFTLR